MGFFGKKKEKEKECACSCGGVCAGEKETPQGATDVRSAVKVLGSGCKKCAELEANTKAALEQLGMDATVEHVTDYSAIASYGVMSMPALVIGEKVVSTGKILNVDEVVELIKKQCNS